MPAESLIEKYKGSLKSLFPVGKIWETILESAEGLLRGCATEFARVEERANDLLTELDPLTSTELLEDWEALLGLPDECTPENQTIQTRREQARGKLAAQGGSNASYFEQLAEGLGFPDTIVSDFKPFEVGRSVVSEKLTNYFDTPFAVGMTVGEPLYNWGWTFFFEVNSLATVIDPFEVGIDTVGEPLVEFGNPLLECSIRQKRHAHTYPYFTFRDT